MWAINEQFLVSLVIIAIGYVVKRTGLVTKREGQTLSKLILNITLPALIIVTFAEVAFEGHLLWLALIAILYGVALMFFTRFIFKKEVRPDQGVFVISLLGFNVGLFAYPFVETIWGAEGLKHMAFFDMGNAVLIFGLAYIAAVLYAPGEKDVDVRFIVVKLLTFFPLIAYVAALMISLFEIRLPDFGLEILNTVASANAILVLLLLGIYLEFHLDRSLWTSFMKVIVIKYGAGLSVGLILFFLLPFDDLYRATILLGLVLPTGMAVIPYAVQNKLNDSLAGGIVNLTNIVSFLFMWGIFLLLT